MRLYTHRKSSSRAGAAHRLPGFRLNLRPATLHDLPLLCRWDEQPHVVASDPNDDWEWETELGKNPDWREQLIAEVDARPIGFVQIIDPAREESRYWGDAPPDLRAIDLWIGDAADLGRGYGTEMMRLALARCFAQPRVRAVLIERRRFGRDDCFVYRLDRANHYTCNISGQGRR